MGFSAGAALRFGWETFKRRPWFFIGSTLIIMLVSGLIDAFARGIDAAISGSADEPSLLGSVISLVGGTLINMGATAFYLAAHDNPDAVDLSALWHPRPFLKFLGASILLMLAIVAGLILLIVPGIIFALMFMFTTFIVIDRDAGPIEAIGINPKASRMAGIRPSGLLLTVYILSAVLAGVAGIMSVGTVMKTIWPLRTTARSGCFAHRGWRSGRSTRCSC